MLSKANIKFIQALRSKKRREKSLCFVVEGEKISKEVLCHAPTSIKTLFIEIGKEELYDKNIIEMFPYTLISAQEMKQISHLSKPSSGLAVLEMTQKSLDLGELNQEFSIFLDEIQDPGNLGTILRLADWFGIKNVICAKGCVDIYNPKVIQASMGAFLRVNAHYIDDINIFFDQVNIPIFQADMSGENAFDTTLPNPAILIIGSEGQGVTPALAAKSFPRITIPRLGGAESLNAAMATSILVARFLSPKLQKT